MTVTIVPPPIKWRVIHAVVDGWRRFSSFFMGGCKGCGSIFGVKWHRSRTAYHYEGVRDVPGDPNGRWLACPKCRAVDDEYWSDMWAEYYSGRI